MSPSFLTSLLVVSLRSDGHETLLSLSVKMSELQKELSDVPDTVKVKLRHNTDLHQIIDGNKVFCFHSGTSVVEM